MKRALFVTTDRYPDGDAGSVRTYALAKALQSLGYEPTVIGMGDTTHFEFKEADGISYSSFRLPSTDIVSRVKGRLQFGKRLKKMLLHTDSDWDVIIVSLVSGKTMKFLKKFTEKKQIPLLHDSVEWFSPEQFSLGRLHPSYITMDRRNRKHVDTSVRVIAISSYLENHFRSKGILTSRIPVVMDTKQIPFNKKTDETKIVFTYAGSPGKKDYLDVILKGFAMLSDTDSASKYELRIIGVTKESLLSTCDEQDVKKIEDNLICFGRIPRAKVLEHLSETDFTVLMRSEEQRYAKAGFPTKFVESLATATPVIANSTSDIAMYLKNGENGFIVPNDSPEALSHVLLEALNSSYGQRCRMQKAARRTAEADFDYTNYLNDIEELINA